MCVYKKKGSQIIMSMNINPIRYQVPNYSMYGVDSTGKNKSSSKYISEVLNELDLQQAELKVKILTDKCRAQDATPEQKYILKAMLLDAIKEHEALRTKLGVK